MAVTSVGTTTYQYAGNEATVTNAENKKRKYAYNEFGQVSQVTEQDSAGNLTVITTYAYNTLGKLTQIVQGSQTRTFAYDSLGRLTSETHPEGGTTTSTYDDNSNVAQTQSNYERLIAVDHVNFVVGPFDDAPTVAGAEVAARHGYAFINPTGTAPSDFQHGLANLFTVSLSASKYLGSFERYVLSLPASMRLVPTALTPPPVGSATGNSADFARPLPRASTLPSLLWVDVYTLLAPATDRRA